MSDAVWIALIGLVIPLTAAGGRAVVWLETRRAEQRAKRDAKVKEEATAALVAKDDLIRAKEETIAELRAALADLRGRTGGSGEVHP